MSTLGVLELVRYGALLLLAVISGYTDFRYQKVYNCINFPALALGLLLAVAQAMVAPEQPGPIGSPWLVYLGDALGGATFCLVVMGLVYIMGGLGAGDLKLMVAAGSLAGLILSVHILMLSVLTGVAIGLSVVIWKGKVRLLVRRSFEYKRVFHKQKLEDSIQTVPFGTAFAGGCLWAVAILLVNSLGAQ